MSAPKVDLIRQALSAAESSIKLARQLLIEVETEGDKGKTKAKELPGVVGMFDGQNMVTEKGENFPVPENYASKSILVAGDTLKLVGDGVERRFKQIEHVKRHKTIGILAKKDGKWAVVTPEGSYRVLNASVEHFDGSIGDEVLLQLPANSLQTTWAAVENISKKGKEETKTMPASGQEVKGKVETVEKPEVKAVLVDKQETKADEEKVEKAPSQEKKPPEPKPESKTEEKETRPKEDKPKPSVPSTAKPVPAESKPPIAESKPVQAAPKPAPVEAKPAPAEPKPTAGEVAEDELR